MGLKATCYFFLSDNDYKHFAEERNLRGKVEYSHVHREKVNQDMINYGFIVDPINSWAGGNYIF